MDYGKYLLLKKIEEKILPTNKSRVDEVQSACMYLPLHGFTLQNNIAKRENHSVSKGFRCRQEKPF